jgi:8-oxo-(d)GTP phosphatase
VEEAETRGQESVHLTFPTFPTEEVRAAGGVVARRRRGAELEVLLVHRPRYDDWTLPKGKHEPGESDRESALREVLEETGIICSLGVELGVTRYVDSKGRDKSVRYFAMRPLAGRFRPHAEVDEIAWLPPAEACRRLTYPRDVGLVEHALAFPPPLYLHRHGSAGERARWRGDDELRPLDERGRLQARELRGRLEEASIERVLSSPYVRCVQSVEPLAAARRLRVEQRDELAEGAPRAAALGLVREVDGTGAVLCSHGDVLELLLGTPGEKGSTRIADLDGEGLQLLAELPPPA